MQRRGTPGGGGGKRDLMFKGPFVYMGDSFIYMGDSNVHASFYMGDSVSGFLDF